MVVLSGLKLVDATVGKIYLRLNHHSAPEVLHNLRSKYPTSKLHTLRRYQLKLMRHCQPMKSSLPIRSQSGLFQKRLSLALLFAFFPLAGVASERQQEALPGGKPAPAPLQSSQAEPIEQHQATEDDNQPSGQEAGTEAADLDPVDGATPEVDEKQTGEASSEEPDFADRLSEAVGPVVLELVARFSDYVFGPEGVPYMPLDVIGVASGDGIQPKRGKLPEPEADGVILSVIDKEARHFSVELEAFEGYASYQLTDVWCWAAAIQSYERFKGLDPALELTQRDIVERVFIHEEETPIEDRSALSFQIVQAIAYDEDDRLFPFEMSASIGWIAEMEASDYSEKELVEHIRLFIDHYMGSQEIVESLLRGEPVLVSIAGEHMNHIQVLYGAEFSPIRRKDSNELKVRAISGLLEQAVSDSGLLERGLNMVSLGGRFQKRYALRKVKLFDPWKAEADPVPERLQINEYSADDFRRKVVYSLNREVAEGIITAARQRANVIDREANEALASTGALPDEATELSEEPPKANEEEPSSPSSNGDEAKSGLDATGEAVENVGRNLSRAFSNLPFGGKKETGPGSGSVDHEEEEEEPAEKPPKEDENGGFMGGFKKMFN